MKFSLSLLIAMCCLILSSGLVNAAELTRAEQAQALIEDCKIWDKKLGSGIIYCTDKKGYLSFAYDDLYRSKVEKRLPERARNYLQLHSIKFGSDYTLTRIEVLKQLGMAEDDPMILQLHGAIKWAETYKAKSAEELYNLSQDKEFSDPLVRSDFVKRVQKEFLAISEDKGYEVP